LSGQESVFYRGLEKYRALLGQSPLPALLNPFSPRKTIVSPRLLSGRFLLASGANEPRPTHEPASADELNALLQFTYTGAGSANSNAVPASLSSLLAAVTDEALSLDTTFRLVLGDLSGIQSFIHASGSRRAARSLRARSFYLQVLSLGMARLLSARVGMSSAGVLSFAGGNFQLLIPASALETLLQARAEVERSLTQTHGSQLAVALGWSEPTVSLEAYSSLRQQAAAVASTSKNRPHEQSDARDRFAPRQGIAAGAACRACGRAASPVAGEDEPPICRFCRSLEEVGSELRESRYLIFSDEPWTAASAWNEVLSRLGIHASLVRRRSDAPRAATAFALTDEALAESPASYFMPVGRDVPRDRVGNPLDFEALAGEAGPRSLLAVAKLDVDDLGQLMEKQAGHGLPGALTFGKLLSLFFEGRVNELAKDYRIYMVFSGGDDVLCAGALPNVIDFLVAVRREFLEWTDSNPHLHMSCGISVGGPSRPISRAMLEAEELLTQFAKQRPGKNSVHVMGVTLSWEELAEVNELRARLVRAIRSPMEDGPGAGRSLLHRLQLLADLHDPANADGIRYGPLLWQSHYSLRRFAERNKMPWIADLVDDLHLARGGALKIALAARLAELATAPSATEGERSE
jgi:CRISPR-associated protein Csm1